MTTATAPSSSILPIPPSLTALSSNGPLSPTSPSSPISFVVDEFESCLQSEPNIAIAVAAMQSLTSVVKRSQASTMMGLEKELKEAIELLKAKNPSSISLAAGCELFSRHVTRIALDNPSFSQCVARLVERGQFFTSLSASSRSTIASSISQFIQPSHRILIHGYSRVVMTALRHAVTLGTHFSVITTEARPYCDGYRVAADLTAMGIHTTLILDSAISYILERVDLVIVGAEGVVESGGIINKVGTYGLCMMARVSNKPVYVCAECYKFSRLFPLSQRDLPEKRGQQRGFEWVEGRGEGEGVGGGGGGGVGATRVCERPRVKEGDEGLLTLDNPQCDYTPPQYLTLLFTDLGILTPSAVSDELIKLYY